MKGFDDDVLTVPGALFGVRVFDVSNGDLVSPYAMNNSKVSKHRFTSTHNVATCGAGKDHEPGSLGCTCGFYAYTAIAPSFGANTGEVVAIVRGYGHASVGTRGFRSQYLDVVAFYDSRSRPGYGSLLHRIWSVHLVHMLVWAVMVIPVVATRSDAPASEQAIHALASLLMFIPFIGYLRLTQLYRSRTRSWYSGQQSEMTDALIKRYPDIPWFTNFDEMTSTYAIAKRKGSTWLGR